ncbi:MAG: class I SAM-dependent methyltransferase [Lachnospiraceae bacterium]|nr:class I SAM-dependent methyltransferase [Lachnospiraceae bacterium]
MYSEFAWIYDDCMDNVPYDRWAEFLTALLREHGLTGGIVADLGCGTGEMTLRLAAAGYDMIGVDASEEMLEIAREKGYDRECSSILYLHQDLRELELFGTVGAFVSVCDTMNYLLTRDELIRVFRLVNNYLERGGLFVFDMKTARYYRDVLGDRTRTEQLSEGVLIWENAYDEAAGRNEYALTMFLENKDGLYERSEERHVQQAYSVQEVIECLTAAGMEFVAAYSDYTREPADEASERVVFVAKEGFQKNKTYL